MKFVELEATAIRYFSHNDELAFFSWLQKITCVTTYEGRGMSLRIVVDESVLDENCLRELIALFHRYKIPLAQLKVFDRQDFAAWFKDSRGYWYSEIFGA